MTHPDAFTIQNQVTQQVTITMNDISRTVELTYALIALGWGADGAGVWGRYRCIGGGQLGPRVLYIHSESGEVLDESPYGVHFTNRPTGSAAAAAAAALESD